jgi:hypothetical protein
VGLTAAGASSTAIAAAGISVLNALRLSLGFHWSGISTTWGVLALAAGLGDLTGVKLPLFPICLVIVGASLILKPLVSQKA